MSSHRSVNSRIETIIQAGNYSEHHNERESLILPADDDVSYSGTEYGTYSTESIDTTQSTQSELSTPTYSLLQVRLVTSIIVVLYSTNMCSPQLMSQYLLDRWSLESGHNLTAAQSAKSKCDANNSDPIVKKDDELQEKVSSTMTYFTIVNCGPAIFSALIFGAVVDILGRRPAFITSILGATLKMALIVCVLRFDMDPNFFYVACALDGICGSIFVNFLALFSLLADINFDKSERIFWYTTMSFFGASTLAGTSLGVGLLIEHVSYFAASLLILGLVSISFLLAIFLLPETFPASTRQSLPVFGQKIKRVILLYTHYGSQHCRRALAVSLVIFFLTVMNTINLSVTDTLYQRHRPLCWNPEQIGYYTAIRFGGQNLMAVIFMRIHQTLGCVGDEVMAMVGCLFMVGSYVLEAFVQTSWQMYLVPLVGVPASNIPAITRGVMSVLAGPERQGALFASIAAIEALCSIASTSSYNKIYSATVDFMPGLVYLVMAGVAGLIFILYFPFFYSYNRERKSQDVLVEDIKNEYKDIPAVDEIY